MTSLSDADEAVFRKHLKPIVHLRKQREKQKLCLVLGAGACKELGMPNWKELNERIAKDDCVEGAQILDPEVSGTLNTQRLFEHFRARKWPQNKVDPREAANRTLRFLSFKRHQGRKGIGGSS